MLTTPQVANHVASRCVEMLGGVGFVTDFPVEKFYRDSKIGTLLNHLVIKCYIESLCRSNL